MRLYLVRHGRATSAEEDPRRPLSERGRQEVIKLGEFFRARNLKVGAVWHSGKARAAQTAEILAPALNIAGGVAPHDGLAPNDAIDPIRAEIETYQSDLMIVGHLPFVAKMAARLAMDDERADIVVFTAATIVCLEGDGEDWHLMWMMTPDLLI